jgi:hypothetical protein
MHELFPILSGFLVGVAMGSSAPRLRVPLVGLSAAVGLVGGNDR